ncbi:MAG: potassium channel protein [Deltaproteobacteria bacterium]|nr:potassium channel protein [Deltaproteobacteria bacterium]
MPRWLPARRPDHLYYGAPRDEARTRYRLLWAGAALVVVVLAGTAGYWLIGQGRWPIEDCAYIVFITITTVGYGEILPLGQSPHGRLFTMGLLAAGMGVSLYFLSSLTAFIVEGDLREAIWRRRMQSRLAKLKGHFIVCGTGRTGRCVVEELVRAGRDVVVIDADEEALDRLVGHFGDRVLAIRGDSTEEAVLYEAGVEQAAGLVAALALDRENLFICLTARGMNPSLRIVSRGVEDRAEAKLKQAGADVVICPTTIGGRRMAHDLLRPNVVGFLDLVGLDEQRKLTLEEVAIGAHSPLVGLKLVNSRIREVSNALVLGVVEAAGRRPSYNPPVDFEFAAGMTLIVLGESDAIERLTRYVQGS